MSNLYAKLAGTNIRNNRQFYLPYLLTGILNVAMFYMIVALCNNEGLDTMRGGRDLKMVLTMGVYVIGIFSAVFLFYTNSFIIKRRKREIGIYNILGMEKRHISKVLFMENLFVFAVSVVGGLVFGIVFSKLMTMFLYRLTGLSESIVFAVSLPGVKYAFILFAAIFIATFCYNLLQIRLANPLELLSGSNVGEREPKTKGIMAVLGVICIAVGYGISIFVKNPLEVVLLFFVAVVLVIIGTYCLFTAGSIALLKILRKNKNFYYKSRHFTAVSGMIYRMKQNAVGLANICILSTMVLVMVSATISLYYGVEDELNNRYPTDLAVKVSVGGADEQMRDLLENVKSEVKKCGRTVTSAMEYADFSFTTAKEGDIFSLHYEDNMSNMDNCHMFVVMTREDFLKCYPQITEKEVKEIPTGEVSLFGDTAYDKDTITFDDETFRVVQTEIFEQEEDSVYQDMVGGYYYMLVNDEATMDKIYQQQMEAYGINGSIFVYTAAVNMDGTPEEKIACADEVQQAVQQYMSEQSDSMWSSIESRDRAFKDFYALYGGLFFLGLFLGTMFLMVTVLIIFYKQISEGYDDKKRFEIMEKVGMSNDEVKATIRSQVRIVFLLPLVTAAIHLFAAFPMLSRLLALFSLTNANLFITCIIGTILIFGIIYYAVFKMTSKTYYKIVGNQV